MSIRRVCAAIIALAVSAIGLAVTQSPAAAAEVFTVYLRATGSDANDGMTPETGVKTLDRVQAILSAAAPQLDVEVRIGQGAYVAPRTYWRYYIPGHTISFMPIDYEYGEGIGDIAGRPVFRGNGTAGFWFSARLPAGHSGGDTNLRFYYLQVERYSSGAVELHGGTTTNSAGIMVPATAGANRNVFFGNQFSNLGTKFNSASIGYGGIDAVNSSGNVIENNHFLNNENTGSNAGLIHGVYLAHHSNGNVVKNNRFRYVSGGPMRTRNDSNDNDIFGNSFERAGRGGYYSEWFCDSPCVAENPGHARECASHGNLFHDNDVISGYTGGTLSLWQLTPAGTTYAGGAGCDNEGKPRLRTYGNT
jgi:hypothetical protein